jgi:hypothetical protein
MFAKRKGAILTQTYFHFFVKLRISNALILVKLAYREFKF